MLSKGFYKDSTDKVQRVSNNKIATTLNLLAQNKGHPTVIWVTYNYEQELYLEAFKQTNYKVTAISGETKEEDKVKIIEDFRNGKYDVLINKPKLLGFGLNLPFVTVQISQESPIAMNNSINASGALIVSAQLKA